MLAGFVSAPVLGAPFDPSLVAVITAIPVVAKAVAEVLFELPPDPGPRTFDPPTTPLFVAVSICW
jgi:hypothetical protein